MNHLKIFLLAAFLMPFMGLQAQSKLDKKVLLTIGDQPVTVKEFTSVYDKNNLKSEVVEKKSVDEYLDLFVNFRMKVMEAEALQLDTSAKFQSELTGYRKQLAKPYFTNDDVSEDLVQEAYERKKYDIRASHILIQCDKHAAPADTLKAYEKAMDIRARFLKGEDFGTLAQENSDDPSARDMPAMQGRQARKGNKGDLGYFTVFDMVYPFETGAYNTQEGQISMPVRTDFGYHLVFVSSKTESIGLTDAAHIFLALSQDASEEEETQMLEKANNIYNEIMVAEGRNWSEAVSKYTDDRGTIGRDGALSKFTVSRIVPEFIEQVKKMQPNEISQPVRTSYGIHIIKLLSTTKLGSYDDEKQAIKDRVEKDMRSKKTEEAVVVQIKRENKFKQNNKNLEAFISTVDSTILSDKFVPAPMLDKDLELFRIANETYRVGDFVGYIQKNQNPQQRISATAYAHELYDDYVVASLMEYEDKHLEIKYPDFAMLVREYHDGILLFDLMEKQIWEKAANDSVGLAEYHSRHAEKYMWKDRVEAVVFNVTRPESLDKAREYAALDLSVEEMRARIADDSVKYVYVRKGFFQRGDNPMVDQTEWAPGTINEIPSTVDKSTAIVKIIALRQPEPKTLKEAKGLVTSDYQVELEEQWIESLHAKYPVVINEKILDKVKKNYK